jgi:dTDP-4-dehydrorhamnose reductase
MIKVLITGAQGQLAQALAHTQPKHNYLSAIYQGKQALDITHIQELKRYLQNNPINYLINCAAYTQVDQAETDQECAYRINSIAPGYLASLAQELGFTLLHISTDYVFEGLLAAPLTETMPTNPVNCYGKSKLTGEQNILAYNTSAYIIRTSWLFDAIGNNFLTRLLGKLQQEKHIGMVYDQISSPTYVQDLAKALWKIILQLYQNSNLYQPGIYHYANEGVASRYDLAWNINKIRNLNCNIVAKHSSDFPGFANRPFYSVLDKEKIKSTFGLTIPHWQESLSYCLHNYKQ